MSTVHVILAERLRRHSKIMFLERVHMTLCMECLDSSFKFMSFKMGIKCVVFSFNAP